jgi:hypothetical protein
VNTIKGTFKNGEVVLDDLPDWPEGCRLRIAPDTTNRTEDDSEETPEQIEEWLRWYHTLEPLEFTAEEEADLTAWRRKVKEYEISKAQQQVDGLFP